MERSSSHRAYSDGHQPWSDRTLNPGSGEGDQPIPYARQHEASQAGCRRPGGSGVMFVAPQFQHSHPSGSLHLPPRTTWQAHRLAADFGPAMDARTAWVTTHLRRHPDEYVFCRISRASGHPRQRPTFLVPLVEATGPGLAAQHGVPSVASHRKPVPAPQRGIRPGTTSLCHYRATRLQHHRRPATQEAAGSVSPTLRGDGRWEV